MAIVGVAKFLGCEKTLVKNPSEAVGPYKPSDGTQCTGKFVCFLFKEIKGSLCWSCKYYHKYKEEEAMGAEEEKKT